MANTSGNGLVSEVVRRGDEGLKADFEELMRGGTVEKLIDEEVVFSELATAPDAAWALLLAAGYVTSPGPVPRDPEETPQALELTNREVRVCFDRMVRGWFSPAGARYDQFARAQIEERAYAAGLVERGIAPERIRTYGIAFRGKEVLVG